MLKRHNVERKARSWSVVTPLCSACRNELSALIPAVLQPTACEPSSRRLGSTRRERLLSAFSIAVCFVVFLQLYVTFLPVNCSFDWIVVRCSARMGLLVVPCFLTYRGVDW